MSKLLQIAKSYHSAGFNVIPCNDAKQPEVGQWTPFQKKAQSEREIDTIFKATRAKDSTHIALICGVNGLEVIDFDTYKGSAEWIPDYYKKLLREERTELFEKLVFAKSKSGGLHIYYRCDEIEGNQKLAGIPTNDKARMETVIETRGQGGYIIAPPSKGYKWIKGDHSTIQKISKEDRDYLIFLAKSFDQKEVKKASKKDSFSTKPGDDFNERGLSEVQSLLEANGWKQEFTRGDSIFYKRPFKKDKGQSAHIKTSLNKFFVWSTNAHLFDDWTGNCGSYDYFEVFTRLKHSGDHKKAAADLLSMGYGSPAAAPDQTRSDAPAAPDQTEKRPDQEFGLTITLDYKPTFTKPIITLQGYQVLKRGGLMTIVANPGTGKSHLCEVIVSSYLANTIEKKCDVFGLETGLESKDKIILYIDTERDQNDVYKALFRIINRTGATEENGLIENRQLKNTMLKSFVEIDSPAGKFNAMKELVTRLGNKIGLLIIDGASDVVSDTNDLTESQKFSHYLVAVANKFNFGVITTIHAKPESEKARGHLGSELMRKSDSVFILKKEKDGIRSLTTESEFGKNRNDADQLQTAFVWSDDHNDFVTADNFYITDKKLNVSQRIAKLMKDAIGYSHNDLVRAYMKRYKRKESSAKAAIKSSIGVSIEKKSDGFYYLMQGQV